MVPLIPAVPAFGVAIDIFPLDVISLSPAFNIIIPPVVPSSASDLPALSCISPPTPVSPSPTLNDIVPPLPPVDLPLVILILPDVPPVVLPVVISISPDTPPSTVDNDTLPLLPCVLDPLDKVTAPP